MKIIPFNAITLLNRPMLMDDLTVVDNNNIASDIRELNRIYRNDGLPVMNGNFLFSNLLEGPDQALTSSPYRLWEYSSLFELLSVSDKHKSFLDIGGAASPLPFLLSGYGFSGLAIDLQPLLVDICNYVASVRNISLKAKVSDITRDYNGISSQFDFVTCISVIEHISVTDRINVFRNVNRILKPGGLFYITFDYGSYRAATSYLQHNNKAEEVSESISDIRSLCSMIIDSGFKFIGNNPLELPIDILNLKSSPGWQDFMWRSTMNTRPMDAKTPWGDVIKYCAKRLFHYTRAKSCRFKEHNFFRIYLEK